MKVQGRNPDIHLFKHHQIKESHSHRKWMPVDARIEDATHAGLHGRIGNLIKKCVPVKGSFSSFAS